MNAKTFLILSIAANVLLAVALMTRQSGPSAQPVASAAPRAAEPAKPVEPTPAPVAAPEAVVTKTNTLLRTFGWEAVESADYKQYIANLRSIGCPEETIRDIIVADVNKLYDAKKKAVRGDQKKFEFWKSGNPFLANVNTKEVEEVKKLEQEKNDLLRALGIEPDIRASALSAMVNPFETMMDFLPEEKKSKVMETMMKWQTKMAEASEGGRPLPEDIAKIQKGMEAEISAMLSPEENFDYQMRFSMTANVMRQTLSGFEPSQEEFVEIFNLRKGFDDQHSLFTRGQETPEQRKQRETDEKALKEALKEILGEGRFADYEMAQDWKYQQAQTAAKRSNLDNDVARQAWEMRKAAEEQAAKLRKNKEMDSTQRQAALAAIRLESEKSIQAIYGEEGWKNYQRGNGSTWLNQIYKDPTADGAK